MATKPLNNQTELLAKIAEGDQRAFESLYAIYSPRIYKRTLQLVRNQALAEEVLQDVFLKIWDKRKQLNNGKSFQALLYTIATNMVIDLFRKAAIDQRILENFIKESGDSFDPLLETSEELTKLQVDQLLDILPEQRRNVYKLVKLEQKSYEEVAALLGICKSTVSDHVVKATKALKTFGSSPGCVTILLAVMIISTI